jgi:error-prone DNA polymerase
MYAELHVRSAFSFLEGASLPETLVETCADYGIAGMALLDRDGVYGAPRFHLAATKRGICAYVGAEAGSVSGFRYPLLVASRKGYQNLCRLITRMKLRAKKGEGAISLEELADFAEGLICLTGGEEGPLAQELAQGGVESGGECLEGLIRAFGRQNVYVELQRHSETAEEARNQAAIALARRLRLPLLATQGACYAVPEEREIADVFTCIRHHKTLESAGRLLSRNAERHLKPPEMMSRIFADLPEAIAHTQELAARLTFTLEDLGYEFPRYPAPPGETMASFLRHRTEEGMMRRYGRDYAAARHQVERELALIEKLKLEGYFLIVWDIVQSCRTQNILVQGRGSAANSAVCYSLGITAVDPVGMGLLFERFLSEQRGEWPDIDLDLPSGDQRERAIQYVYQKYGQLGAAMTANVITYRGRSAAREIGKALSFDPEMLDRLSGLVGGWEFKDSGDTLENYFRQGGLDLTHARIRKFLDLCLRIQDFPRHLGQHSGGMIVCQGQLDSVVPLEPATMPGRVVAQWDKDDCADMKIVKIDLLGLGMMAVLEDSITLIRKHYREDVDLAHLPQDDPKVYRTLQKADSIGMFQVESRAQMSCLPRLKPKKFYDLVVEVAIIRPGPITGKMVHPYLRRRQGIEKVTYPHPSLEPVLKRTLGVPLFQEQLLRMAMIVAGFSGGEAEELRRAFGYKRAERRMHEVEAKLRLGMDKNGISKKAQDQIVEAITSFALYGFPESHAASFALLAYASAYLKVHYLAAFTAALLNNQPMGFYHPATIVKDAQRHGLKIRPVDVTQSEWNCTLEPDGGGWALRLGMRQVKHLREEAAQAMVHARDSGEFISMDDLVQRVPELRKDELMRLAEAGALNWLTSPAYHRRAALWEASRAARPPGPLFAMPQFRVRNAGLLPGIGTAAGLKAGATATAPSEEDSPLAAMNRQERLAADFRQTGLTVGPHPMIYQRSHLHLLGVLTAAELPRVPAGRQTRIAGCVICRQRPGTAKGFVFLSLEDETGIANAIVPPALFSEERVALTQEPFLVIEGKLERQDQVIMVRAEQVWPLATYSLPSISHDFR